ncbi:right-handed parallel beta-helix repeat-containing protein [Cohnella rhizosphaerae]|uniref:Right-handed parallel beta-helix repeat-containing protein n=1 Tax=Cohnella rhizosphaerae TaxID=1457232 RepID=A0A9X4KU15_9BACL|nr:right-handed parallel beta-helix repeat-containing protein [Cohnella rhizosphaerae]MDG0810503.1 right-handed parallel beta-helix repeat-containing protein [Cohnella rhizosphaerae]
MDDVTVAWQPTSPSAVGPVDRSEDTSVTPAFEWRDAHADSYTLVIGRDSGLTEVTQVIDGITDNAYTLPASAALDYDTVYYWKVVAHKGADSWSGGSAARLTTQLDASGNRVPVLFSAAPTEAKPGEMFQLFGASFDTDDVRLLRLDDTPAAGLEALIGAAADPEALDRDEAAAIGEPYGNDTVLRAVVPAAETPGMYAVWAVNDTQWSAPKLLNKTTVYFASPNRLNAASSREVRIIGKQLAGDSNAAYVYLVDEEGDATAVTLEEAGPYELVFEWPLALGPGTYEIWTHNGYGGAYGWGETQTIEVVDEPFSTYSASIATYGAIPDDGLDDRAAIQAALDAADGSGGGTVLVPAGTYDISNTLHVGEHTALKGLGKDAGGEHQSVIKFITGDPVGPSTGGIGKAIVRVGPGSGVEDLKLVGSVSVDMGIDVEDGADDVFIRNNEVRNYFPTSGIKGYYSGVSGSSGTTDYFERLQIVGNTFEGYNGINFDLSEYGRFIDNTVLTRRYTPIAFTSSSKNIIEGNTIDGRNASGVREASRGITFNTGFDRPGLKPNEMNYVSDNNITYVGNQAAPTNDGEYVLFDNNGDAPFPNTHYYGAVADGTPESLTFANVSWTANQMKELYVLVVDGRGLGQYRKVTGSSGGTIYVDKPWDVTPDYRSKAVVARFHTLNLVVGNHAYLNKGNNFVLWGNVLDNIVDGNEAEQGGSTVSALDHSSHPSQYGAAYYNLIQNADSPEAAITYSEYGYGSTARASVISYGNTLRRNDTDRLSFRTNSVQSASGSVRANLLEHNKVGSAIVVTPNARNNVLRENAVSGAWPLVADGGESTIVIERGLLPAPSEVSVIPAVYGVQLNWSAVTGADGYYVFRKLHGSADSYERLDTGTGAGPLAATSWLDADAAVGELYDYRVATYADGVGQGHAGQPQAGFSGAITAASLTAAEWQWTAPYDGEVEALASLRKLDGSDYDFELRVNGDPAVGASVLTSVYQAHERISLQAGDELTFVWTSADPGSRCASALRRAVHAGRADSARAAAGFARRRHRRGGLLVDRRAERRIVSSADRHRSGADVADVRIRGHRDEFVHDARRRRARRTDDLLLEGAGGGRLRRLGAGRRGAADSHGAVRTRAAVCAELQRPERAAVNVDRPHGHDQQHRHRGGAGQVQSLAGHLFRRPAGRAAAHDSAADVAGQRQGASELGRHAYRQPDGPLPAVPGQGAGDGQRFERPVLGLRLLLRGLEPSLYVSEPAEPVEAYRHAARSRYESVHGRHRRRTAQAEQRDRSVYVRARGDRYARPAVFLRPLAGRRLL